MSRKSGLGRGLDALIEASQSSLAGSVNEIPIENISANPRQPRRNYPQREMDELANSIREYGVIQPLIVSIEPERPDHFTLIAGERRLIAAKQAGFNTVPVVLREATEQDHLELALIENLQRTDLNPMEEAEAYRQLAEDFDLTHDEISSRVGKSRSEVTNTLRLLTLAPSVQEALIDGSISKGHARAMASLASTQSQSAVLRSVIEKGLNVRQTEELVKKLSGQSPVNKPPRAQPPEIIDLEDKLRMHLEAKVNIRQHAKGGTVIIRYYSEEELNSLIDKLLPEYD